MMIRRVATLFGTKLGDDFLDTPFSLTWDEYQKMMMRRSVAAYYRNKNAQAF